MDTEDTTECSTTFYFSESSDTSPDEDCHSGCNDVDRMDRTTRQIKQEESDESPLHSLESEAHGITIQRYISKYMDHGFDESFIRETKKRKERENLNRTLKAAMQHSVGERTIPNRQLSRSTGNLTFLLSPSSPVRNLAYSPPIHHSSDSPSAIFQPVGSYDTMDKLEVRRKKHWRKARTLERDVKKSSALYEPATPSPVDAEKLFMPADEAELKLSIHPQQHRVSHPSAFVHTTDCPLERVKFYKTFSLLIRMGNREKQCNAENEYKTMENIEERLCLQAIKDYLWLELKAWQGSCSPSDQKKTICMQRRFVSQVLHKILTFSITGISKDATSTSDSGYSSSCFGNNIVDMFPTIQEYQGLNEQLLLSAEYPSNKVYCDDKEASTTISSFYDERKTIQSLVESLEKGYKELSPVEFCLDNRFSNSKSSHLQLDEQDISVKHAILGAMCGCNKTLSRLCQNCINKETEALLQVTKVLDKLDETEHLYSCSKALGNEHPLYNNEEFIVRVKTLNLWLNITTDLRRKIDSLAKLFEIQEKWKVGWPCYDQSEMFCSSTDEKKHSEEEEQKSKLSLKIVHFQNSTGITSSPSTSGSDKGCCSIPVSPDVQTISPFDTSSGSSSSTSCQGLSTPPVHPSNFKYSSTHIYQRYVDKTLRHKGLKFIYSQLTTLLCPILNRVHAALKRPKPISYAAAVAKVVTDSSSPTKKFAETALLCPNKECCEELSVYGVWSEAFQKMGLPTFHRPFLFLLHVPLDVVHHCLQLRIQQQPEEPSSLSVGQLIKECKEVLRAGIQIRQRYINLAQTVFGEDGTDIIEAQLNAFDEDLKTMLQIYLRYLEKKKSMMEELPGIAVCQKNSLEEEWAIVRATCPHIPGGEALAAKKFCFLASDLLNCIGTYVEKEIENSLASFNAIMTMKQENISSYRKGILQSCRMLKRLFNDAGNKARQAVAFAKTLRKDLEIAAEYKILVPAAALLQKLQETGHVRVIAPHSSSHVMFVPGHLQYNETYIWQLVDMTCGHENIDSNNDQDIYLIMMRYEACSNAHTIWQGPTILLEPTAEATITLSQIEVDGLLLVVNHSSQLMNQCRKFQRVMSNTLQTDKQQTSCNHAIAEALGDLKVEALLLCEKITGMVREVEKHLDVDMLTELDEADRNNILASYREVLHQGYKFGFEYQKGVARLITGEARTKLGKLLISFARQWMKFVSAKCERGRGHRPRWATQGLEFLIAACDPEHLQNLTNDEFQDLKQCMNNCITHLIGSPMTGSHVTSPTHQASPPSFSPWQCVKYSYHDINQPPSPSIEFSGKCASYGSFPTENNETPAEINRISRNKTCCVRTAINKLEQKLQDRQECRKTIGRVSNVVQTTPQLHISARRVNFPWQRGFKIGEGRFGKVYTAVNNLTGELIAMKEIHLQPNDHRAIKEAMDEIRTFEGIKHPNVVHYYGVEIHREEMLIFMEYCNEGSLESAAQLQLPESLVRKYTRNLLDAVNVLHEHGIVHRDIKSANIFLTSDGNLKLGDFGCCIKLKNHSTMPGELCSFVGTPAYMAPEIFTKNFTEGHGRAADIWSIGCVVLEMASGRRPWHDLDNSYQIMFRVGMGEIPEVPDTLSGEGQDFLNHCLQHDPHERWTASMLLDHPFTKVNEDDDCI